jgi:hypothetical protein
MKWETAFVKIDEVNEYLEQRVADRWFDSTVTPVSELLRAFTIAETRNVIRSTDRKDCFKRSSCYA